MIDPRRIPELRTLFANIEHFAEEQGLSLAGLCKKAGLDLSALAKIKRAKRGYMDARLSTILALSHALGISLEELIYRADVKNNFIVPRVPTEEMLEAGEMAMSCIPTHPKEEAADIYNAMIVKAQGETLQ